MQNDQQRRLQAAHGLDRYIFHVHNLPAESCRCERTRLVTFLLDKPSLLTLSCCLSCLFCSTICVNQGQPTSTGFVTQTHRATTSLNADRNQRPQRLCVCVCACVMLVWSIFCSYFDGYIRDTL